METRTDIELIATFASSGADPLDRVQGEAAFAELVNRHQQMVFRTCLRMLNDAHEAQDTTQATFIVLMKKADRLKREGALGGWLHAVARRVSLEAIQRRSAEAKRREAATAAVEPNDAEATVDTDAVLRCVDEELERLSVPQRQAVVLRYLQGHSQEQSSILAGCPLGTMKRRASDGIASLRSRLAKRGVAIGLPAVAAALVSEAQATIPETLLPSILTAAKAYAAGAAATGVLTGAAVLAKGAMDVMFWSSVKTAVVVTAACVVVAGTCVVVAQKAMKPATSALVSDQPKVVDLYKLVNLSREQGLLVVEWVYKTNPAYLGKFQSVNPSLGWIASGTGGGQNGRGDFTLLGTNDTERVGSGIFHIRMRANGSNFWVRAMYGTKSPFACIEYIQNEKELRLIRTVWKADGSGQDPDRRLDARTARDIEELKAKAGDHPLACLAQVLAMFSPVDLLAGRSTVSKEQEETFTFPKTPNLDHRQYRLSHNSAELEERLESIIIPGWRTTEEPLANAVSKLIDAISTNDPQHARVAIELDPPTPSLRLQMFTLLTMDSREFTTTAMQILKAMADMSGQKVTFEKYRVVLSPLQPDKTTVVIPEVFFKDTPVPEVTKALQNLSGVPIRLQHTGNLPSITLSAKDIQLDNAVLSVAAQAGLAMGYEKDGLVLK